MFPEPVIHVAVEPKTKADQDKMGKALYSLSEEDPTFQVRTDEETGQTIISGMGELHLEVLVDRMLREFSGRRHRRQAAGRLPRDDHPAGREGRLPPRQADRWLGPVRPRRASTSSPPGPAAATSSTTRSPAVASRRSTSPRSTPGIQAAMTTGVLAGFPTVDVQGQPGRRLGTTTSTRRRWRSRSPAPWASRRRPARPSPSCSSRSWPSRSSPPRTTWATSWATCRPAGARSAAWSSAATARSSERQVPLSEMFGYSTDLRSRTQGRATYTMQFDSYQQMPASVQEEIVKRVRGE